MWHFILILAFMFACFDVLLFSASGGGGERVLWVGVQALFNLQAKFQHVVIYAGDEGQSKEQILHHVKVIIYKLEQSAVYL